jgi:hypothetical protein
VGFGGEVGAHGGDDGVEQVLGAEGKVDQVLGDYGVTLLSWMRRWFAS